MFQRIQQLYRPILSRRANGPLRCLFVITSMPVGGAETLLVNLMHRMDRDVMIPEIACLKEAGPLGEQIAGDFFVHSNLLANKFDLRILLRLIHLMTTRQIDVVITVGAGDKMFWGRLAAKIAGVPVIASALHSTGWPDGVGRLNRTLTRITDAFIAVADSHGKFLQEFEKFPAEKIIVVRNGIDCDRFKPDMKSYLALRAELGVSTETPIVGIVAALRPEKNHAMFLHSAALVIKQCPDAHFVIVGDGPERAGIEALRGILGLAGRVHLLGTRHDVPQLVAALDVFALSSLNEASPVSILEALSCGVPVVSTDVGSIAETVIEGVTGHLVASEDAKAMSTALVDLLKYPENAIRMGEKGRAQVLATGSLDAMVRGYESLATRIYDTKVPAVAEERTVAMPLRK